MMPAIQTTDPRLTVLTGLEMSGQTNVSDEVYAAHIASSIRRQHPQLRRQPNQSERICLVGGGPSLAETEGELVDLLRAGAKLVTVNGAYHWALARNLTPSTQVVLDARASNARFVDPPLPRCQYLMASTCHPDLWDRLEGRPGVWIFHPVVRNESNTHAVPLLDAYYGANAWVPVGGGTTVTTRALFALRLLGYLRFDLFGFDSCWAGDAHHAYPQPENDVDKQYTITVHPGTAHERAFVCAGWHVKQLEDFLQIMRINGNHFQIAVHGDGLIAYVLRTMADAADILVTPLGAPQE